MDHGRGGSLMSVVIWVGVKVLQQFGVVTSYLRVGVGLRGMDVLCLSVRMRACVRACVRVCVGSALNWRAGATPASFSHVESSSSSILGWSGFRFYRRHCVSYKCMCEQQRKCKQQQVRTSAVLVNMPTLVWRRTPLEFGRRGPACFLFLQ